MNKEPTLIIMAAGLGSRYGGLKQMEPMDEAGHIIMDFSIYDAMLAGFKKAVFVIKEENESQFREVIGDRIAKKIDVEYVYQKLDNIPEGFKVPEGREKPWGTGHAVLSCINAVDGSFAVINADDYYGRAAFRIVYDYLTTHGDDDKYRFCMAGFVLGNTLTDNGYVARGVCEVDEKGFLTDIVERKRIEKRGSNAVYTEDDGLTWVDIPFESIVSMNMWGFSHGMLNELEARFPTFLEKTLVNDPLKGEYFLPSVAGELVREGKATVSVEMTPDKWYGVTYKEDRQMVTEAIKAMEQSGKYPENF